LIIKNLKSSSSSKRRSPTISISNIPGLIVLLAFAFVDLLSGQAFVPPFMTSVTAPPVVENVAFVESTEGLGALLGEMTVGLTVGDVLV